MHRGLLGLYGILSYLLGILLVSLELFFNVDIKGRKGPDIAVS